MKLTLLAPMLLAAALPAQQPPPPHAKPRVFLAGAEPERISGQAFLGDSRGGVDVTRSTPSYDIESMRTFSKHCPDVVMTTKREKADLILRIERDDPNPTTPFVKANRIAVFNLDDELVYATRARLLGNAAKDACQAILAHARK